MTGTFQIQNIFLSECENVTNCFKFNLIFGGDLSGVLLILLLEGKKLADCLYFYKRNVKSRQNYFIQPIPTGFYKVYAYEISISGLMPTTLPVVETEGEIKQGKFFW